MTLAALKDLVPVGSAEVTVGGDDLRTITARISFPVPADWVGPIDSPDPPDESLGENAPVRPAYIGDDPPKEDGTETPKDTERGPSWLPAEATVDSSGERPPPRDEWYFKDAPKNQYPNVPVFEESEARRVDWWQGPAGRWGGSIVASVIDRPRWSENLQTQFTWRASVLNYPRWTRYFIARDQTVAAVRSALEGLGYTDIRSEGSPEPDRSEGDSRDDDDEGL